MIIIYDITCIWYVDIWDMILMWYVYFKYNRILYIIYAY